MAKVYTDDDIINVFTYHIATPEQAINYMNVREAARDLFKVIRDNTPPCADQHDAFRKVREAVMTANAAIALKGLV